MLEKQDSKQNHVDDLSTSVKVGLTATTVCYIYGFILVMNSCQKDCMPLQGVGEALLGVVMMGTSPVVGLMTAGVSEVAIEVSKLSLFAHKKIVGKYNKDEPLAKLKTP